MADIKVKEKSNIKIRKFDKAMVYSQRIKNNIVDVKKKVDYETRDENSATEYGINKIENNMRINTQKGIDKFNQYGQQSVNKIKESIEQARVHIKKKIQTNNIKRKLKETEIIKQEELNAINAIENNQIKKTLKNIKVNNRKKVLKNMPKTTENTIKLTQKISQENVKGFKKKYQIAKLTAEKTVKGVKSGIELAISSIKAIIKAMQTLVTVLIAGGWIAIVIIVLICFIGLICSSAVGIFFSNEDVVGSMKMSSVISEINRDFTSKITEIQNNTEHDDFEISSNRAEWKDVIAVYSVLVTGGNDQSDVITLDEKRAEKLKNVFWQMNTVSSRVENVEKDIETVDEKGNTVVVKMTRKVLYIDVASKTIDEMIQLYNFNDKQLKQLAELRKEEYNSLWLKVIYGATNGSSNIVQVAISQVGNVGGEPFWSWYGFSSRVEWCACFVSWCAEQCGYIESGIIPKFASCQNEGIAWFKTCGLWQEKGYTPKSRRYNLF